ncbi:alpha-amylase [Chitinophaga costaii]|uniref:Alpha-amylase n=1 Tax=Chitinophaga costaii TaxID=1335309 RepID=A0A1C4AR94_9BACT|nr:alpha-amylase [Chitinophaga costaii]PUZ26877.1 alpha-amylase [Chitinophaga costaii]SCB97113.1 alpha-amylase [Chitinophaga costaii]
MQNETFIQFFHWYTPADGALWQYFQEEAPALKAKGITHVWLPPAFKGSRGNASEGYDVYDLFDLGEFDQKGTVATKYGTKDQYLAAIKAAQQQGLKVLADIVMGHRTGGDDKENVTVRRVNPDNRNEMIGEPIEITAYTKFTFPGRKEKYSNYIWDFHSFAGVDYAENLPAEEQGIFKILNEYGEGEWNDEVSPENGNFSFLIGDDVETRNPAVRDELYNWGKWYLATTGIDGLRLDAIKHTSWMFVKKWVKAMREAAGKELTVIGEYWAPNNLPEMIDYLNKIEFSFSLFDAPLHNNFHQASKGERELWKIYDDTLTASHAENSITLVDNHDTQPLQALESPVEGWFKPLAYGCILLRLQGVPCVFYPDLYGVTYKDKDQEITISKVEELDSLLELRKNFAYGEQQDYFVSADVIGWVRKGIDDMPNSGCVVIMSRAAEGGNIKMNVDKKFAGKTFYNFLNHAQTLVVDEEGSANFYLDRQGIAVWVAQD